MTCRVARSYRYLTSHLVTCCECGSGTVESSSPSILGPFLCQTCTRSKIVCGTGRKVGELMGTP
jgi:hypothetical protein